MKCLVTGGAGFIGSHIVDDLVSEGMSVVVIDNLISGFKENLPSTSASCTFVEGDVQDKQGVDRLVKDVDVIVHQAALKMVPESFEDPYGYNEVNIQGTLNLLEAARKNQIKKFVYASSSALYGNISEFPTHENVLPIPQSPYAISKFTAEQYCTVYDKVYDLPTTSLRYFNVYGPGQTLNDGYSNVIPKFISCVLQNEMPPVFGDGTQSRDFVFVKDVSQANILSIKKPDVRGTFNVGTGENFSLLMLIEHLNSILNKDIKPKFLERQPGDVDRTLASLDKIKKEMGYVPKVSFRDGLKHTISWFRKAA